MRYLVPILFLFGCSTCPPFEDFEHDPGFGFFCIQNLMYVIDVQACVDARTGGNPQSDLFHQAQFDDCWSRLEKSEITMKELEKELKAKEVMLRNDFQCPENWEEQANVTNGN